MVWEHIPKEEARQMASVWAMEDARKREPRTAPETPADPPQGSTAPVPQGRSPWQDAVGYHHDGTIEFRARYRNGQWWSQRSDEPMRITTHAHLKDDPSTVLWDKRLPPTDDIRGYKLAAELGVPHEILGGKAKDLGIRYRNYMTMIPVEGAAALRKEFALKKSQIPTALHKQLFDLFGPVKITEGDNRRTWVFMDREEDPTIGGRIRKHSDPLSGDTYRVHVSFNVPCPWGTAKKQAGQLKLLWSENRGFEGSVANHFIPSPLILKDCNRCGNKTRIVGDMCTACFRSQSMP